MKQGFIWMSLLFVASCSSLPKTERLPENVDLGAKSPSIQITAAYDAVNPVKRDELSRSRKGVIPGFAIYDQSLVYFNDGISIDPETGAFVAQFYTQSPAREDRFTSLRVNVDGTRVIETSLVSDDPIIRSRVLVDPNFGFELDGTNLSDNPCIEDAVRRQDLDAVFECIGLTYGNDIGPIGAGGDGRPPSAQNEFSDWFRSFNPPPCEDSPIADGKVEKKTDPVIPIPPKPVPTPAPPPSTLQNTKDDIGDIYEVAFENGDAATEQAANDAYVATEALEAAWETGDYSALPGAALDFARSVDALRRSINNSPLRYRYPRNSVNFEPVSPEGGDVQICSGNPRATGPLWDNEKICGDRSATECLAAINDLIQILTEGKCATVPGQNDQPMVVCNGPNDTRVGTWPPVLPDPDKGDECSSPDADLCWTDPNTGPRVRQTNSIPQRYIDLLDLKDVMVGICSVDGCPDFPQN